MKNTRQVRVVRRKNGMYLIEWEANHVMQRTWVTPDMVVEEPGPQTAIVYRPEAGIPYGIDFARLVNPTATSRDIDQALKRKGIWTADDLKERPTEAVNAIREAYGVDFAGLVQAVREHEKESS